MSSTNVPGPTEGIEQITEAEVINRYKGMRQEISAIAQKIAELELDENEHNLVIGTLEPLEKNRKAFRLVGGILVERTVGEVLPAVVDSKNNINGSIKVLTDRLKQKEAEAAAWQKRFNIRTHQEAMAQKKTQDQKAPETGGKSSGVLA